MYYRNAQAALVVYDLTKAASLIKAKHWVAELQRQASPGIVIALVGNKLDLCSGTGSGGSDRPSRRQTAGGSDGDGASNAADAGAGSENGGGDNVAASEDAETGAEADAEAETEADARKVPTAEAKAYADDEGLLFFETSAKTGTNVLDVFTAIANAIPESTLKGGARGGPGSGGIGAGGGAAAGAGGRADYDQSRVNLSGPGERLGAKDSCAC